MQFDYAATNWIKNNFIFLSQQICVPGFVWPNVPIAKLFSNDYFFEQFNVDVAVLTSQNRTPHAGCSASVRNPLEIRPFL